MRLLKNLERFYPYIQSFLLMAGIGILASSYCTQIYPGWANLPTAAVVGLVVLALGLVAVFRCWKGWSLAGAGGVLLVFFLIFSGKEKMEQFFGWLVGAPSIEEYPDLIYTVILLTALLLILGFLLTFLMQLPLISLISVVAVVGMMLYWDIRGAELAKSGVVFLLVYLFSVLVEICQRKRENRSEAASRRTLVSLSPFFFLFFFFLMIAPTAKEAYRWGFLTDLADGAKNLAKQIEVRLQYYLEGDDRFSLSFAGHGTSGKVGGTILSRDQEYLRVRLGAEAKTSVYVIGSVWDTFDEGKWSYRDVDTGAGGFTEQELDFMEMIYALYRHDPDHVTDYVRDTSGSLAYLDIYTKNVFYMPKYRRLGTSSLKYSWEGANALFQKPRGRDTNVTFSYLQLNLGSEIFDDLILKMQEMPYREGREEAISLMKTNQSWRVPDNLPELLEEREAKIREVYGVVPDLSQEVKELVEAVTRSGENPYEKLKLLEEYLGSYAYTGEPEEISGDFLTGFLCETKEGYCTYFATAFVELARYLGFPARYVQGFVADSEGSGQQIFLVEAGDAHAWAEVYLHGLGWIPFEATPGYGEVRYQPWSVKRPSVSGGVLPEDDYHQEIEGDEEEMPELPQVEPEKEDYTGTVLRVLGGLAVLALILFLLYGFQKRQIERRPEEVRYYLYWKRIFYLLSAMGLKREEYDTMEDFRLRLRNAGDFDEILPDKRFESFANVRYGGECPKERELKDLAESVDALLDEYKKTHPKVRSIAVYLNMILRISG